VAVDGLKICILYPAEGRRVPRVEMMCSSKRDRQTDRQTDGQSDSQSVSQSVSQSAEEIRLLEKSSNDVMTDVCEIPSTQAGKSGAWLCSGDAVGGRQGDTDGVLLLSE
jgi:hypothetical protein